MTKYIAAMDDEEFQRIVRALASADSTLDHVLDTLPKRHPLYSDLASIGNWVRASHRRMEAHHERYPR
jgi:hypothetical protein